MNVAQPLRLRSGLLLPNRIAKAAMTEGLATPDGRPTAALHDLYRLWAHGGAGLLITGNVMVDGRYLERPGNVIVEDERSLDGLAAWAEAAHVGCARVLMQVSHPGRQTSRYVCGRPLAPSNGPPVRLLGSFARPRAMTPVEIADVVDRFAFVAGVAERAGFDGVQVHAAHGYLLSEFLSPLTNRREDAWGGSIERRARLLLDVLRAIRARTSAGFSLSVKLNSADFQRGGFEEGEALRVIEMLESEGVDLLEVSGGTYESPAMFGLRAGTESTRAREAYFLDFARKVRETTRMPLMVTGGFRSVEAMEAALTSDALDAVGLARPLLLDPSFPAKVIAGTATKVNVPVLPLKSRTLAALAEAAWHDHQLHRLAAGAAADVGASVYRAMVLYFSTSAARGIMHRLTYRRPADATQRGARFAA